jgi:hypothetical protein
MGYKYTKITLNKAIFTDCTMHVYKSGHLSLIVSKKAWIKIIFILSSKKICSQADLPCIKYLNQTYIKSSSATIAD